jgi:rRNA maturation protein Nop10
MDMNSCDTCNVSGNHLMDHCPECGDPFAYPTMGQKFRATLGIFGLLAIAAVFAL